MKRVRLVVAYDGTNYCGWQIQANGITIEEVLNKALSDLLREPVAVIGASRTDSGVHANGNVAVFDTDNRMPADKICLALNQRLPADIRILGSQEVPSQWHPRKQNCVKTYEYRILNRKIDMPTLRLYTHFCYVPLNVGNMKAAAAYLTGEHDFKSFCTVRTQGEETVRTVYALTVDSRDDIITIRISGSGFLYNMVRIIAGTLIKVGMGAYPPEHAEEILDARDRQKAGPKAPAKGLTLIGLEYESELQPEILGENKDWKYRLIQKEVPSKGKAYLVIERCENDDFARLLQRVTHQAVRNGAEEVYVCDRERDDRIEEGRSFGYYAFVHAHDMWRMVCPAGTIAAGNEVEAQLEPLTRGRIPEFCTLYNEVFFRVPNSAAMTEQELTERLELVEETIFFVKKDGETAGFLMLKEKDGNELEIDSIGIRGAFKNQGIASAVIIKADALAVRRGMKVLSLLAADSNENAFRLYQKLGFRKEKRISAWYGTRA